MLPASRSERVVACGVGASSEKPWSGRNTTFFGLLPLPEFRFRHGSEASGIEPAEVAVGRLY